MMRICRVIFVLLIAQVCLGQSLPWSSILPSGTGIDWSQVGIQGGIPDASWTQSGSTLSAAASPCSNGSGDCTTTIQNALNSCGTDHFVLLGTGTFKYTTLALPSNCVLRGTTGTPTTPTVMNCVGTGFSCISFGSATAPSTGTSTAISSGATQGSTSIVVASATGISAGKLLLINQLDPSFVTEVGTEGTCTWCANGFPGSSGQVVEVLTVVGTTVTFRPPLYYTYSPNTPKAYPFSFGATNAGLEYVQLFGNASSLNCNSPCGVISMDGTKYSWMRGVEMNFTNDGNSGSGGGAFAQISYSMGNEFRDSFLHDGFDHGPGQNDNQFALRLMSSANLVENNIIYRGHVGVMFEWGGGGNVVAYNYFDGNYHDSPTAWMIMDTDTHGAHPWFNLIEGNIAQKAQTDTIWGSSSHFTFFRNWYWGSRQYVPPFNSRGVLNFGSAVWEDSSAAVQGMAIDYLSVFDNLVGNVVGSTHLQTLTPPGYLINPATGGGNPSCIRIGYNTDTTNPGTPNNYSGTFIHGTLDCNAGTFVWTSGVTHTLPISFYLALKPAYWPAAMPYPPIGPDVSGGTGFDGFANANPAQACFNNSTKDSNGYPIFDPIACYAIPSPPQTAPASVIFAKNRRD